MKQIERMPATRQIQPATASWFVQFRGWWRNYRETHRRIRVEQLSPHLLNDLGLAGYPQEDLMSHEQVRLGR